MYKTINYADVDIKLCDFENDLKIKRSLRLIKKKKKKKKIKKKKKKKKST
jgi:hypothetical protein